MALSPETFYQSTYCRTSAFILDVYGFVCVLGGGGGCRHLICALESLHLWQNKEYIGGDKAPEAERPVRNHSDTVDR